MVLVQAPFKFALPDRPTAQLVQVPPFGHQDVAGAKCAATRHASWHGDLRDRFEAEASRLDVGDTQVGSCDDVACNVSFRVDGQPVLQAGDIAEAHQFVGVGEPESTRVED
ncbi:hypothetical protein AQJ54_09765 [Streptomyces griseorubiginosus]|uniref:Uncharacterized protein n=1 Tax=Streptomyces griseorubiginosus TaxID=67304 RepID=A0A124HYL0_9ACTN|nr:hypothetical protein AQJ54_09765 [Streptomyces griseorubiginosus]